MTKEEKVEKVVKQAVKKILTGKYDTAIFNELSNIPNSKHIAKTNWENAFPTFSMLTSSQMPKCRAVLKKALLKELNNQELSFLQTMRIVKAIGALDYSVGQMYAPKRKAKFCVKIWQKKISDDLKIVGMLDNF